MKQWPKLELEPERGPEPPPDWQAERTCPLGLPSWHWMSRGMGTRPPLSTKSQVSALDPGTSRKCMHPVEMV